MYTKEEVEKLVFKAMNEAVLFHEQGSPNYDVLIEEWIATHVK